MSSPLLPPLAGTSLSSPSSSAPSQRKPQHFFLPSVVEPAVFHPHPSLSIAAGVTAQSAGVGLLVSAVQNALDQHNRGAMGIFTRTGGTITFFAAMGFSFSFAQAVTANMRETDDALNAAAGGCAAGLLAGARARSIPIAFGSCAVIATLMGTFDAAGKNLTGTDRQALPRPEREARRLEFFKKPRVAEVGEGQGQAQPQAV